MSDWAAGPKRRRCDESPQDGGGGGQARALRDRRGRQRGGRAEGHMARGASAPTWGAFGDEASRRRLRWGRGPPRVHSEQPAGRMCSGAGRQGRKMVGISGANWPESAIMVRSRSQNARRVRPGGRFARQGKSREKGIRRGGDARRRGACWRPFRRPRWKSGSRTRRARRLPADGQVLRRQCSPGRSSRVRRHVLLHVPLRCHAALRTFVQRLVGGVCASCLGLVLVLCCGARLFTGVVPQVCSRVSGRTCRGARCWELGPVWLGNLAGSRLRRWRSCCWRTCRGMNGGEVGATFVSVASAKIARPRGAVLQGRHVQRCWCAWRCG